MMSNWLTISQSAGTGNATITVNAQGNPTFEERTARIVVSNGSISKTVYIVQEAKTPSLSAITVTAPAFLYIPYSGGTVTSADSKSHLVVTAIYDNGNEVDVTSAATYNCDRDQVTATVTTNTATTMTGQWFHWLITYKGKGTQYTDWVYQYGVPETRRIVYSGTSQILLTNSAAWHYNSSYVDDMNILANSYNSTSGTGIVVFDKDAITIPYEAFKNNTGLTAVDIPSSVSGWSESSFKDCTNLVSINGLENVAQLGNYGTSPTMNGYQFLRCSSLTHVGLPASMPCPYGARSLTYMMFSGCTNLTTLIYAGTMDQFNALSKHANWRTGSALRYIECSDGTIDLDAPTSNTITYNASEQLAIPDSAITPSITSHTYTNGVGTIKASGDITSINASGFSNNSSMTSIDLPDNLETINGYAFASAVSLTNISIPDNVTDIDRYAFWHCSGLTSVNVPTGVTTINASTFSYCSSLTAITMPNVTKIVGLSFYKCISLPEITIPSSITEIGNQAFYQCSALSTINYNGTMAQWGNVSKPSGWYAYGPATVVHCTDGDVSI